MSIISRNSVGRLQGAFHFTLITCSFFVTIFPWSNIFQFGSFMAENKTKHNKTLCRRSRKVKLSENFIIINYFTIVFIYFFLGHVFIYLFFHNQHKFNMNKKNKKANKLLLFFSINIARAVDLSYQYISVSCLVKQQLNKCKMKCFHDKATF